jgi:hypothetical protein
VQKVRLLESQRKIKNKRIQALESELANMKNMQIEVGKQASVTESVVVNRVARVLEDKNKRQKNVAIFGVKLSLDSKPDIRQ